MFDFAAVADEAGVDVHDVLAKLEPISKLFNELDRL